MIFITCKTTYVTWIDLGFPPHALKAIIKMNIFLIIYKQYYFSSFDFYDSSFELTIRVFVRSAWKKPGWRLDQEIVRSRNSKCVKALINLTREKSTEARPKPRNEGKKLSRVSKMRCGGESWFRMKGENNDESRVWLREISKHWSLFETFKMALTANSIFDRR